MVQELGVKIEQEFRFMKRAGKGYKAQEGRRNNASGRNDWAGLDCTKGSDFLTSLRICF